MSKISNGIVMIDIDKLVVDGCNIRDEPWDACENFITDIKTNSVTNPLLVRPLKDGKYGVVAGSRRFNGSIDAGLSQVPCIIKDMDDLTALGRSVSENALRKNIEVADYVKAIGLMCKVISANGWHSNHKNTKGEICEECVKLIMEKTGLHRTSVQNYISLSENLSEDAKELLKEPEKRTPETREKEKSFKPKQAKKIDVNTALKLSKEPKDKQLELVVKGFGKKPQKPKPQEPKLIIPEKVNEPIEPLRKCKKDGLVNAICEYLGKYGVTEEIMNARKNAVFHTYFGRREYNLGQLAKDDLIALVKGLNIKIDLKLTVLH